MIKDRIVSMRLDEGEQADLKKTAMDKPLSSFAREALLVIASVVEDRGDADGRELVLSDGTVLTIAVKAVSEAG